MKRRRLGQHQLLDPRLLEAIIQAAEITPTDEVLEIGAGNGNLTSLLCGRAGRVCAYEVDPLLFAQAQARLRQCANLQLVREDGLRHTGHFDILVSNLPYSISRRFIEWLVLRPFKRAVVTLQREFATKLLAAPGSHIYRVPSILAQARFNIEVLVPLIPPTAFSPPPRISSSLLRLTPGAAAPLVPETLRLLKLLLAHRGRRVAAALRAVADELTRPPNPAGLDPELLARRIENLSPTEALALAERCAAHVVL